MSLSCKGGRVILTSLYLGTVNIWDYQAQHVPRVEILYCGDGGDGLRLLLLSVEFTYIAAGSGVLQPYGFEYLKANHPVLQSEIMNTMAGCEEGYSNGGGGKTMSVVMEYLRGKGDTCYHEFQHHKNNIVSRNTWSPSHHNLRRRACTSGDIMSMSYIRRIWGAFPVPSVISSSPEGQSSRNSGLDPIGDHVCWELPFMQGWLMGQNQSGPPPTSPLRGGPYRYTVATEPPYNINLGQANESIDVVESIPMKNRIQSQISASLIATVVDELPCTIKLKA
ncbi:hypothetical protein M8C21_001665 [Ambrosia artemisiifolia]|uniref:Uncharacterized protein n=1 Tax=Ambrosia artemisiifolia TaxID=4212 RepID=A0AAD5D6B6_AMBAR|nr:hypothetical protein M8C21_001665 [Ambrosia artemisiifolia]